MGTTTKELRRPIRLMFGLNTNDVEGFSVVYEEPDGSADKINVWFHLPAFRKVRFIDAPEESCVVWEEVDASSFFHPNKKKFELKEIRIRKDAQLPVALPAK